MKSHKIEDVKMPIIYIALSIIISAIDYGLFDKHLWLVVLTTSLFFIFTYFYTNFIFTSLMAIIFIIELLFCINFYNVNINKDFSYQVKIVKNYSYGSMGSIKGRNIYIFTDEKLEVGGIYKIEGEFSKEVNKENGEIGKVQVENIKLVKKSISYRLNYIKRQIYNKISKNIGNRKASLVSSVAFGYSDYLDNEDDNNFRSLGIIHAISVSGLHVALIYGIMEKFLNKYLSLGITAIYVIFTGAAFSSIRAFIMIVFLVLSLDVRKKYSSLASLCCSLSIILLVKPYAIFQVGLLLSYGGVLSIILFNSKIERLLYKLPNILRSTISLTISAQILTLPIIILAFNQISYGGVIGNLIVLPIINLIIVLGNGLIISYIFNPVFDFICYLLLIVIRILDQVVDLFYNKNELVVVNYRVGIFYCIMLISFYFIIKNKKIFVVLPILYLVFCSIDIYSPFINIKYLREGGILISYKGNRKIVLNTKNNLDIISLKQKTLANQLYWEFEKVTINDVSISNYNNNYLLTIDNVDYILKINYKINEDYQYKIIDLKNREAEGLYIINNKIYLY